MTPPSHDRPIETPEQAGQYLETLINHEQRRDLSTARMDLGPIRALLERLGEPQAGLSILHVAGSKGKGSTCLFAEAALGALGKRAGVFTSPHLHRWTERFRVASEEVDGRVLAQAVDDLRPHVDWLRENDPDRTPTFFDATTAAALLIFARAGLDHVVLEVGLGGRLDSTNAVEPRVCAITTIELEHTDKLGDTIAKIAWEKAGIIKRAVPCFVGRLVPDAEAVIRDEARKVGAPLHALGKDFEPIAGDALAVLGRHQQDNAALALACVEALEGFDSVEARQKALSGICAAVLPGRIEVLDDAPRTIVDAAHTQASARELAAVLAAQPGAQRRLLLSVSEGKDLGSIFDALLPGFDEVYVTRAEPYRSVETEALAALVREHRPETVVVAIDDPGLAAREALAASKANDLLVAAGSVYLAAVAREHWSAPSGTPATSTKP
ncbi:MAG: folylpolyglutamate synthase/dihydrofolate synthase family protein [Myxococcota bacterium]|jgi:dihydrofolate synthase/folylpolyglutamate synthase|nr:folylpolyglutamate synthase/dihydrofolate synthase family protein [Myxococcota bacterium]